ncbi:MAG: hypothetical protein AMXMBFR26_18740 [Porticoccaceae bacterium]
MPCYDYRCREHGVFEELATVAERAAPRPCPQCGAPAARVIAAAPALLDMTPALREACARNERSRHEPRLHAGGDADSDRCGGSCGSPAGRKAILLTDGRKVFPSGRPWMIGH